MCGRFAAGHLTQDQMREIVEGFLRGPFVVDPTAPLPVDGFNVKPTNQIACVLRNEFGTEITSARWWFVPHFHTGPISDWKLTTFNAKIETAFEKPTFRTAWKQHRCIIPALGYYEWTGPKGQKQPWYITTQRNTKTLFFAGLYSRVGDMKTCTILTRAADPAIQDLHHRMPVILTDAEADPWLDHDPDVIDTLGTHWGDRFLFHKVEKIGRDDNGPHLIEPLATLL